MPPMIKPQWNALLFDMPTLISCTAMPCYLSCSCSSWALKVTTCWFCQLLWKSAKFGIWFICLACLIHIHPWVCWPQVLCMDCWESCRLARSCIALSYLYSVNITSATFWEHECNSLPWFHFSTKYVIWNSSLASLLYVNPWFLWA